MHYKQLHQNLRNLKHSKPAEYWDTLNKASNCKEKCGTISLDTFMCHFEKLGEKPERETATVDSEIPFNPKKIMQSINEHINRTFTQDSNFNKTLKNKKACGIDNVINEYLKNSPTKRIVLIVKMFNLVILSCQLIGMLGSLSPFTKSLH